MKNSILILLLSSVILTGCFEKKETAEVDTENNPELIQIEDTKPETNTDIDLQLESEEGEDTQWSTNVSSSETQDATTPSKWESELSEQTEVSTEQKSTQAPIITPLGGDSSASETPAEPTKANEDTTPAETNTSPAAEPVQTGPAQTEPKPSTSSSKNTSSTAKSSEISDEDSENIDDILQDLVNIIWDVEDLNNE